MIRVAVNSRAIVAMTTPIVASLADRVRKISSVWPLYFFPGAFAEIGGYAGGEADKKAVKENDDTCGSQNTQRQIAQEQQDGADQA